VTSGHAYAVLGFGQATGADEVFFLLVAARVIEPVSKLDGLRVLEESAWRRRLRHGPGLCPGRWAADRHDRRRPDLGPAAGADGGRVPLVGFVAVSCPSTAGCVAVGVTQQQMRAAQNGSVPQGSVISSLPG
jgi:hypothetical protein